MKALHFANFLLKNKLVEKHNNYLLVTTKCCLLHSHNTKFSFINRRKWQPIFEAPTFELRLCPCKSLALNRKNAQNHN